MYVCLYIYIYPIVYPLLGSAKEIQRQMALPWQIQENRLHDFRTCALGGQGERPDTLYKALTDYTKTRPTIQRYKILDKTQKY